MTSWIMHIKWSNIPAAGKAAIALQYGYPITDLLNTTRQAGRLIELLESIRGSRLLALNILERELDACVVDFGDLVGRIKPEHQELAAWHLRTIRDYRRRHPQPKIPTYSGDPALHEQAQKILDEIK